jgi:hypothetical protein
MAIDKNFVIKNGLEVNDTLILADSNSGKVGIATTVINYTLDVNGGIGATSLTITGISTITNLIVNGTISVGNSIGTNDQYLASTGTGVTWKSVVVPRTSTVYTASIGATSFLVNYEVGLVDVYINGIRLAPTEFTATNGTSVGIADSCFGGETVELVVYNSL